MATKKKREVNQRIAALKTDSTRRIAEQYARSLAAGEVRILAGSVEIVRPQRVTS